MVPANVTGPMFVFFTRDQMAVKLNSGMVVSPMLLLPTSQTSKLHRSLLSALPSIVSKSMPPVTGMCEYAFALIRSIITYHRKNISPFSACAYLCGVNSFYLATTVSPVQAIALLSGLVS